MVQVDFSCPGLKDLDDKARRGVWIEPEQIRWLKRVYYHKAAELEREDRWSRELAEAKEYCEACGNMSRAELVLSMVNAGYKQTVIAGAMGITKQAVGNLLLRAQQRDFERVNQYSDEPFPTLRDYLDAQKVTREEMVEAAKELALDGTIAELSADTGLRFHWDKTTKWPSEAKGQRLRVEYLKNDASRREIKKI